MGALPVWSDAHWVRRGAARAMAVAVITARRAVRPKASVASRPAKLSSRTAVSFIAKPYRKGLRVLRDLTEAGQVAPR